MKAKVIEDEKLRFSEQTSQNVDIEPESNDYQTRVINTSQMFVKPCKLSDENDSLPTNLINLAKISKQLSQPAIETLDNRGLKRMQSLMVLK